MKYVVAMFIAVVLVAASIGTDIWRGRAGDGRTLQSIRYNTSQEISAQRRHEPGHEASIR
jgi:hypothetical protein